jgi:hypothetical protein
MGAESRADQRKRTVNGRTVPKEIETAARLCYPAVYQQRYEPGRGVLVYGTGDYHWSHLLQQADFLERQARAARLCGEWLRTAPDPLAHDEEQARS